MLNLFKSIILKLARNYGYKIIDLNSTNSNVGEPLKPKHIENLEVLTDRSALLKKMPDNGSVAELGVAEGEFSKKILSDNEPAVLYLIDTWGTERYNESMFKL